MTKVYIIDIDDTICYTPKYNGKARYDLSSPLYDRIAKVNELFDDGNTIIYWTARGSSSGEDHTELTHTQLSSWGVKCHDIRLGKPSYDIWVDDKAFSDKEFFNGV